MRCELLAYVEEFTLRKRVYATREEKHASRAIAMVAWAIERDQPIAWVDTSQTVDIHVINAPLGSMALKNALQFVLLYNLAIDQGPQARGSLLMIDLVRFDRNCNTEKTCVAMDQTIDPWFRC